MKVQNKKNRHVRIGVLETNSSSTHSLTVETKGGGGVDGEPEPLVVDNILYAKRLCSYTQYLGEATHLSCGDKDSKAAMVAQWLYSIDQEDRYKKNDGDTWLVDNIEYLRAQLGYSKIELGGGYPDYAPRSECGECYLPYDGGEEEFREVFDDVIKNIILDDTQEIIDADYPN